jgi:hypothetical protein
MNTQQNTDRDSAGSTALLADLWKARLAHIRDKAESHTVTRTHLKEIEKSGILKSGGPITLKEAARDVLSANRQMKQPTHGGSSDGRE